MKCEICHKAEAQTVYYRDSENERQELYVCKACAAAQDKKTETVIPIKTEAELNSVVNFILDTAVKAIDKMTSADPTRIVVKGPGRVCPKCRLSEAQLAKTGRLGCAECYSVFEDVVRRLIQGAQPGTKHTGRKPEGEQYDR